MFTGIPVGARPGGRAGAWVLRLVVAAGAIAIAVAWVEASNTVVVSEQAEWAPVAVAGTTAVAIGLLASVLMARQAVALRLARLAPLPAGADAGLRRRSRRGGGPGPDGGDGRRGEQRRQRRRRRARRRRPDGPLPRPDLPAHHREGGTAGQPYRTRTGRPATVRDLLSVKEVLPFLVVGVTAGSLYGLAALGLVLTYRTSGIFNFAHGALGAGAAYLFFTLHWTWGWPWPLAVLVSVALFGGVAGVIVERLTRSLVEARVATIIVATIGLLLFIQGFLYWRYGVERRVSPDFLPTGTALTIQGVNVSWAQVINFGVGVASLIGLYLLLHRTRLGIAMRGVVASPDLLGLAGTSPAGVRIASWAIGSSFAAVTGILITPSILGMDAFLLSALVVQAFGAVAIGRFTSLPWTYVGGLFIGALAAISAKYLTKPPLTGLPNVIPFLVLIVVMLVTPKRKLPPGTGRFAGAAPRRPWAVARPVRVGAFAAGAALLLAIPKLVDTRISVYTSGLALVVLFLSLSLLTRVSGQISLAHAAFAGVGAATFSKLAAPVHGTGQFGGLGTDTHGGVPWLVALIGAGLVTAAVGAMLALPAMRLSGVYLALATFGFSQLMDNVVFQSWLMFGGSQGTLAGLRAPRPHIGSLDAQDPRDLVLHRAGGGRRSAARRWSSSAVHGWAGSCGRSPTPRRR